MNADKFDDPLDKFDDPFIDLEILPPILPIIVQPPLGLFPAVTLFLHRPEESIAAARSPIQTDARIEGGGVTLRGKVMTDKEFQDLCRTTEEGITLNFIYRDQEVDVRFLGCGPDEIVIEANGKNFVWPRELCSFKKSNSPTPT